MKRRCLLLWTVFSIASLASGTEVFFGEDVSPYAVDSPVDVPRPAAFPKSMEAYSRFAARLAQLTLHVEVQTFENYTSNSFYYLPRLSLINYGAISGNVCLNYLSAWEPNPLLDDICRFTEQRDPNAMDGGTFPISGTKYLRVTGLSSAPRLDFQLLGGTTKAFGFFATGIGSTNVVLVVPPDEELHLQVTAPQGPGGVCFFGVVSTNEFNFVELRVPEGTNGPFGIDNTMIAAAGLPTKPLPARPATLQLDSGAMGLWIDGTVGGSYRVEFSPRSSSEPTWRPFAEFILPQSPYRLEGIGLTNSACFFRAIGLNP